MPTESLVDAIRALTPQQQEAVWLFINRLKSPDDSALSASEFQQAADEFIAEHPELLQRLAR